MVAHISIKNKCSKSQYATTVQTILPDQESDTRIWGMYYW